MTVPSASAPRPRLPLAVKLGYSAFVAVLVPVYLRAYGPTNFLYFCDVALLLTLIAVWTEKPIFASAPAVGILLPQVIWMVDFIASALGFPLTGMTAYMFSPELSLFARGLSFFHFWLPILLVYLVWKLGYDRRAFRTWTFLAWALVLFCYIAMPAPPVRPEDPNLPVNINYVYGLSDAAPQTWMPPLAWVALLLTALPLVIFLPTHLLLKRLAPAARAEARGRAALVQREPAPDSPRFSSPAGLASERSIPARSGGSPA